MEKTKNALIYVINIRESPELELITFGDPIYWVGKTTNPDEIKMINQKKHLCEYLIPLENKTTREISIEYANIVNLFRDTYCGAYRMSVSEIKQPNIDEGTIESLATFKVTP